MKAALLPQDAPYGEAKARRVVTFFLGQYICTAGP